MGICDGCDCLIECQNVSDVTQSVLLLKMQLRVNIKCQYLSELIAVFFHAYDKVLSVMTVKG